MDFILLLASRFSGVVGKILKYSEHAIYIVSFAAVIRVVTLLWGGTLRDNPNNGCEGD